MKTASETTANLIEQGRFAEAICFIKRLWDAQDWHYLKKNKKAVQRIKTVFTEITGHKPYSQPLTVKFWDQKIAKYCEALGVKTLIDDITAAAKETRIQTMVYFLYTKGEQCRWEKLLMHKINQKLEDEKQRNDEAYNDMARLLGLSDITQEIEPDWVGQARARMQQLKAVFRGADDQPMKDECKIEINRIVNNLINHGYPIEPNNPQKKEVQ